MLIMNFKNLAENLIIVIVCNASGAFAGYYAATNAIETQKDLIEQAIDKNTSEIQNTFQNEFKKVKNKKGEPINIVIDPNSNNVISNLDTTQALNVKTEKGFFRRMFSKD